MWKSCENFNPFQDINSCTRMEEYTNICERDPKHIPQRQQCQFDPVQSNQHLPNMTPYNHDHHAGYNMMPNPIHQQGNDHSERLQNGNVNCHVQVRGKGPGSNIQAVDMDVNEILKVLCSRQCLW